MKGIRDLGIRNYELGIRNYELGIRNFTSYEFWSYELEFLEITNSAVLFWQAAEPSECPASYEDWCL